MAGEPGDAVISRRHLLQAGMLCALPWSAWQASAQLVDGELAPRHLWGVNLAGADFGKLLGKHGTEYLYPTAENIAYYAQLGFTLVRIPFKWERLQPDLDAPFAGQELQLLSGTVAEARARGLTVVLDPHNYAHRRIREDGWSREYAIGSTEVPSTSFAGFWERLAGLFGNDDGIILGLMNEPSRMRPHVWLEIANAAIAGIRSTGAGNMLFVPGVAYTGAHSWFSAGNTIMENVADPLNNFAYEVHQYLDRDSSGTGAEAVSSTIGSERIESFQDWARKLGKRAFLGEYNSGRGDVALRALMDLCDEIKANPDVWLGSAAWAGGPRWPESEIFNLEPTRDGKIREQTAIIRSRANSAVAPQYWVGRPPGAYTDFARGLTDGALIPAEPMERNARLTANGLAIASSTNEPLPVERALEELFRLPAFTLLVEAHHLAPKPANYSLIRCDGIRLLYFGESGVLGTELGGGLTMPVPHRNRKNQKRRYALSVSRASGAITLGATDARSLQADNVASLKDAGSASPWRGQIRLGAAPAEAAAGFITRLIGFPVFIGPDELTRTVA